MRISVGGTDDGARFDPASATDTVMLGNLVSNIAYYISEGRLSSLPVHEYAAHALAFDALVLEHAEEINNTKGVARLLGLIEEYERMLAELG